MQATASRARPTNSQAAWANLLQTGPALSVYLAPGTRNTVSEQTGRPTTLVGDVSWRGTTHG